MKIRVSHVALAGFFAAATFITQAPEALAKSKGDLVARFRTIAFNTDTDGTTDALGGSARTSNDVIPEVDFSYFLTDNIAAELILATSKHNVYVDQSTGGDLRLGNVRTLPPVLTLQYHFQPKADFSPYIGAGINYTITYGANTGPSVTDVKYSNEFGYAFQAGFDYKLTDRWSFNVDVKKVYVDTDIVANGGAINALNTDLNPLIIGLGLGYRF